LNHRAHGPIQHQNALLQCGVELLDTRGTAGHGSAYVLINRRFLSKMKGAILTEVTFFAVPICRTRPSTPFNPTGDTR
jgi:hypothetical protein